MPSIVPVLDETQAYLYCPTCRDTLGNPTSPMRREMDKCICNLGHTIPYAQIQAMTAAGNPPTMIKPTLIEQPSPHAVKVQVWVNPKSWARLQETLRGRLWTTIGTLFDALADQSLVLIEGAEARELKKRGLKNGKEIIAAIDVAKTMEMEMQEMKKQLDKVQPILRAAGL